MIDRDYLRYVRPKVARLHFSLRSLLVATFVTAILLAEVVVSFDDEFFAWQPIAVLWTLAPIPAVLALDRFRLITSRGLQLGSMALFSVSLVVPALRLIGMGTLFGWSAFLLSFVGILLFGYWPPDEDKQFWAPIACLIGAGANVLFLLGSTAVLGWSRSIKATTFARKSGSIAFVLGILVFVPLAFIEGIHAFRPAYGLWVASMLALWLGARHEYC